MQDASQRGVAKSTLCQIKDFFDNSASVDVNLVAVSQLVHMMHFGSQMLVYRWMPYTCQDAEQQQQQQLQLIC
jgi:hypothetical protein